MSEITSLKTDDGLCVQLTRHLDSPDPVRKPVLLLHGASAGANTFTTGEGGGLADWLDAQNFDPWFLDWRGSGRLITDQVNEKSLIGSSSSFNFNAAAEHDVTAALNEIHSRSGSPITVVGFCMGSGILAETIARGCLKRDGPGPRVDCVVLMTLGLFYETPMDGRLKSEERILERLKGTQVSGKPFVAIDPRVESEKEGVFTLEKQWPDALEEMYGAWPGRLRSHAENKRPAVHEMCNRLGFLYGTPYYHRNLVDQIHGLNGSSALLPTRFGAIPVDMFIHAARNVRRGRATVYDPTRSLLTDKQLVSEDARRRFDDLEKVTLITGDLNQLWHRNSIDYMYEWLRRGSSGERFQKHVIPGYGHQDLLWGKNAVKDVYETIGRGLTPSGTLPFAGADSAGTY